MWIITKNNTECSCCHSINKSKLLYTNMRFEKGNLESDIYRECTNCGYKALVPNYKTESEYNDVKKKYHYYFKKLHPNENVLF